MADLAVIGACVLGPLAFNELSKPAAPQRQAVIEPKSNQSGADTEAAEEKEQQEEKA
jgi:hypothetical protein